MIMIIISIIVLLVLFLLGADFLLKYYITNLLTYELKYGRSNNEVITKIIYDALQEKYGEEIKQTILEKIEREQKILGFSIKHKLNDIDYQLNVYDQYREKLENELKEKFEQIKSEVKDAMHDTEVKVDTIIKMVRKGK